MKKNLIQKKLILKKKRFYPLIGCMLGLLLMTGCGSKQTVSEAMMQENTDEVSSMQESVSGQESKEENQKEAKRTAVLSGSFADAWLLAGGTLDATTEDAAEYASEHTAIIGTLKNPSLELLLDEEIDLVILSSAIAEHVDLKQGLEQAGIESAYYEVETFEDYDAMMKSFTEMTGRPDLYQKNVTDIRSQIEEQIARQDGSAPSVLFLRAYSTGVKAKGSDSMTGQMLKDLGCVNIADGEQSLLDDLSMEAIMEADPDAIFVTTMGESEEAAFDMVEKLLTSNPAWNGLQAVQNGRYYILPKDLFHNKPNNRWAESYRILADDLYGKE